MSLKNIYRSALRDAVAIVGVQRKKNHLPDEQKAMFTRLRNLFDLRLDETPAGAARVRMLGITATSTAGPWCALSNWQAAALSKIAAQEEAEGGKRVDF